MKTAKTAVICGIASLSLAAAGLAGCGDTTDGTAAALVVNDEEINLGTASFYLRHQQAETESMMVSYGFGTSGSLWGTGTSQEDYGAQFKETTTENFVNMILLRQHGEEYGVSITEEEQQTMQEAAQSFADSNPEAMERMGASVEDVVQVLELYTYQNKMWDPMVADTDREVSDEEAAQTTITYARLSLAGEDDQELTDEEKAGLKEDMEEALSQIQASEDPAAVEFSEITEPINEDFVASSFSYGSDDTIMDDQVKEIVSGMADGEVYGSVIETEDYYYIVRLDQAFDQEATESEKQSIISDRENENYNNKLQGWKDASTIEEEAAWKDVLVSDKDLYTIKTEESSSDTSTDSTSGSDSTDSTSGSDSADSTSGSDSADSTSASSSGE